MMDQAPATVPPEDDETAKERLDRQLMELLQGLRVAVTGVQVLFAFLLTVPFSVRFDRLDDIGRTLFVVSLVAAALASVFLIAPAAQHRVMFREGLKDDLVRRSNRYGIAGAASLAIAMSAALGLVLRAFWPHGLSALLGVAILLISGWAWFGQPYVTVRKNRS